MTPAHEAIASNPFATRSTLEYELPPFAQITEDQAKHIRDTYFPKNNLNPRRISGLDNAMADALAMKFINAPLTKEQLDEFLKYYVK